MSWNRGAACALVVVALSAFAPAVAAQTVEACRDGNRQSAQAVDDDIRVIDDDGWYYLKSSIREGTVIGLPRPKKGN